MRAVISAARIRKLRKELDCTQEQFGELVGRSWSTVARWESRGGIKGKVSATGKKRESVRTLQSIEEFVNAMIAAKMKLERRKAFLVEENKNLCNFAPITIVRIFAKAYADRTSILEVCAAIGIDSL